MAVIGPISPPGPNSIIYIPPGGSWPGSTPTSCAFGVGSWWKGSKCTKALDEFEAALKSCRNEFDAGGDDTNKLIEYMEKYGGGFGSSAIFNCAIQKNPGSYQTMIRECGSFAVTPPWPVRKN